VENETMYAHKLDVTVPPDHRLAVELPPDFPPGPAEIIVLSTTRREGHLVKLAGVLGTDAPSVSPGDPIAEALRALRAERAERLDELDGGSSTKAT